MQQKKEKEGAEGGRRQRGRQETGNNLTERDERRKSSSTEVLHAEPPVSSHGLYDVRSSCWQGACLFKHDITTRKMMKRRDDGKKTRERSVDRAMDDRTGGRRRRAGRDNEPVSTAGH